MCVHLSCYDHDVAMLSRFPFAVFFLSGKLRSVCIGPHWTDVFGHEKGLCLAQSVGSFVVFLSLEQYTLHFVWSVHCNHLCYILALTAWLALLVSLSRHTAHHTVYHRDTIVKLPNFATKEGSTQVTERVQLVQARPACLGCVLFPPSLECSLH